MQGLTIGTSGIARWGSDIGGYHTFGPDQELDRELLARWIELGARLRGDADEGAAGSSCRRTTRPQIWEPETIDIWRRYAKLHTQLNPYLRAADADLPRTGHADHAPPPARPTRATRALTGLDGPVHVRPERCSPRR